MVVRGVFKKHYDTKIRPLNRKAAKNRHTTGGLNQKGVVLQVEIG
jgi:hypothetical protein